MSCSHLYQRQSYWQNSTESCTKCTDRIRLSRGVRAWKSSSNGKRPDQPTSSHRNWSSKGSHVTGIRCWQRNGFQVVGTLPGAFRHRQLGYVDALVMIQGLVEEPAP